MSSTRMSKAWRRTQRHPKLPGEDLDTFDMEEGRCIYDSKNPDAYLIGDAVEVGTDQQALPAPQGHDSP